MQKVHLSEVPEDERRSPGGQFHKFCKDISVALGREPESLDLEKRHPFDLAMVRLPEGKSYCPYHAESAQWELYLIVSGKGRVRDASGTHDVGEGDIFLFKPGEAHKISAAADGALVYYVIADNPAGDSCYYPDSGKFLVRKEGEEIVVVKGAETDYYDGEE